MKLKGILLSSLAVCSIGANAIAETRAKLPFQCLDNYVRATSGDAYFANIEANLETQQNELKFPNLNEDAVAFNECTHGKIHPSLRAVPSHAQGVFDLENYEAPMKEIVKSELAKIGYDIDVEIDQDFVDMGLVYGNKLSIELCPGESSGNIEAYKSMINSELVGIRVQIYNLPVSEGSEELDSVITAGFDMATGELKPVGTSFLVRDSNWEPLKSGSAIICEE